MMSNTQSELKRFDKTSLGFALGMVIPAVVMMIIYQTKVDDGSFFQYLKGLVILGALTKTMSLCVIANLALFYLFLRSERYYSTRGIIMATVIYALATVIGRMLL